MKITRVVWLPNIVDKLAWKHAITPDEVEEVLSNKPQFRFSSRGRYAGEDVYIALGQTDAGRYLIVFFIHKKNRGALVLSAREMDQKERKSYGRK